MAISHRQDAYQVSNVAVTSMTVTYNVNSQLASDLNVVYVGYPNAATVTVADSVNAGNYTLAKSVNDTVNNYKTEVFYKPNIAAAAIGTNVVTVTYGATLNGVVCHISEWIGLATSSPVDVTSGFAGSGTTATTGPVTTTNANDLIYAACTTQNGATGTAGAGYTLLKWDSTDGTLTEFAIVSATGAQTATLPITSGAYGIVLVAFSDTPISAGSLPVWSPNPKIYCP